MRISLKNTIADHPWPITILVVLLWGLAAVQLVDSESLQPRLDIDPALESLLPRDGEVLSLYERTRKRFGSDDVLLVAWIDDDLFTPARLERMPGIDAVDSLATALNIRANDEITEVEKFLREIPENDAEAKALRREALANPLCAGRLVSDDGRGVLIGVHLDPKRKSTELFSLVDQIAVASADEAAGITQFLTGPLFVRLEISRALFRDLYRVTPIAILCTFVITMIGFRNLRGPLLPLVSNVVALTGTLAIFVASGHALNYVTIILPPVVYVVGFAYTLHVVSGFDRVYSICGSRAKATRRTLSDVALPLILTAFTTATGFASLMLSDIASIHTFGMFAALGTLLACAAALTIVPALLCMLPVHRVGADTGGLESRIAPALTEFSFKRRRVVLWAGGILTAVSLLSALNIEVSTDYLNTFPADSPIRRNFEHVNRIFAGGVSLQVLIESDTTDAFKDPAHLRLILELEDWLLAQPEIGGAYTLVDYIGLIQRGFIPEETTERFIPRSAALTEQLLMVGGGSDIDRFADSRFRSTLLHVRSDAISTRDLAGLGTRIERRLDALPSHLRGSVTGSSYLVARTIDDITRGQVASLAVALGVIYLVLVVLFGSVRVGALALLPNALPIVAFFGILGVTGTTLNLTTSLVAAIAFGIAVDDTIHFLTRFNTEARRICNERAGVDATLAAVIRPVTFTTAALCAGFLSLLTGELHNQMGFGLLAPATLLIAWLVDVTFTPALAGRLRFVTLWETLTLDLGKAPHESIPLFAGLTKRQARIAARMGTLRNFKCGERALAIGEEGSDFGVVIDGELCASVTQAGEPIVLGTLRRGDTVGEVAVFYGVRTANVDAKSDARVLTFSKRCLQTLLRRYPRTGAQVYYNLGVILATRLAEVTGRFCGVSVIPISATVSERSQIVCVGSRNVTTKRSEVRPQSRAIIASA